MGAGQTKIKSTSAAQADDEEQGSETARLYQAEQPDASNGKVLSVQAAPEQGSEAAGQSGEMRSVISAQLRRVQGACAWIGGNCDARTVATLIGAFIFLGSLLILLIWRAV